MFKNIFISFCSVILIGYGLFVSALYLLQDRMVFPGPFKQNVSVNMELFKPVTLPTEDGERLFGLYHAPQKNEPVIIFFHGNADAAIYQRARSDMLTKAGFGVLLVEYRGYPGSTGKATEKGLFADGRAAYDFLRQETDNRIGLYAHSLGTGVAVKLASERDVYAVALEAPYDSALAIAQHRFPFVPARYLLKHQFRSDIYIKKVKAPIFIMHGAMDRIIPLRHAARLHALVPNAAGFKKYGRAGHVDLWDHGALQDAVSFFVEEMNK